MFFVTTLDVEVTGKWTVRQTSLVKANSERNSENSGE